MSARAPGRRSVAACRSTGSARGTACKPPPVLAFAVACVQPVATVALTDSMADVVNEAAGVARFRSGLNMYYDSLLNGAVAEIDA